MFCFNIPLGNPTEAADIVFSKFNACAVLIYCFRFLAWIFNHKMSNLFLDVFVLFWGGEPAGKLQVNDFLLRNVVIKNGLLTLAHALLTLAHALLTLCSRFAHALLTFCSRFAHALLTLCSRSPRFFLSPYEFPFGSLRGSAHGAHRLLTVCSRFSHGLLVLLTLCSRFGGWCVYLNEETHKQTMPHFLFWAMCTKGTQLAGCRLLEADFQIWNQNAHMPLTTLRWSGVATPLPQPEICMCDVPFEPKGLRKYILYYGIMTCSFVAQRAQKVHL